MVAALQQEEHKGSVVLAEHQPALLESPPRNRKGILPLDLVGGFGLMIRKGCRLPW